MLFILIEPPREIPTEEQSITPLKIQTLLYIVKKHKWKILTLFMSTVITVAIGSLMATPIYQASAKLLVKPGREDVYVSPTGNSPAIINRDYQGEKVGSEIAILKSPSLVQKMVARIGVDRLFDHPDYTVWGKFLKKNSTRKIPSAEIAYKTALESFDASAVPKTNVIDATFMWTDPIIASSVLNTILELYLERHLEVHRSPQTYDLLKKQARQWEEQLKKSEKKLEDFKRDNSITSLPQQRSMLLGRFSEAESQYGETEGEIHGTVETITTLKTQLSNTDQNVQLQETINKESSNLAALKTKLVELELQGLKEEIERVKEMIAEEEKGGQRVVVSGKSPIRQTVEGDLIRARTRLAALKIRQNNLKNQIRNYEKELKNLDSFENRLNVLERNVVMDEANYKLYLTKFEEAKISENMDKQRISNVSIIQAAVPIMKPVKPKKKLQVMIGSFLGLCTGIGIAFLIEFLNPVFHTREDVQQFLGLPVIATLPRENLGKLKEDPKKAGRRVLLLVTSLLLIIFIGFTLWYFKVHKNAEHLENQATKPELPLSNSGKERGGQVELERSGQIGFMTQAQASPIQPVQRRKIFGKIQQTTGGERSNDGSSAKEPVSRTFYAHIERPKVKQLEIGGGFQFSFKLINSTQREEPITGTLAIVASLEPPHKTEFVSFPQMELSNYGLPKKLEKSLIFRVVNFKDVSGKFDFPFSRVESFLILIYDTDDRLVEKYIVRPEEIEKT